MTAHQQDPGPRWNERWAELAGIDGHLVTDLVGRLIPTLTAGEIDAMHSAHIDLGVGANSLTRAALQAHDVANRNGLRAVAAVAARTAELAGNVHIAGEVGGHEWTHSFQRTLTARNAASSTALALVVRRHATVELVDQLTAVWCAVMGPLRETIPLEPATGDCACGRPLGDVVFAADAAARLRNLEDGWRLSTDDAKRDIERWKTKALECRHVHIDRAEAGRAIRAALDDAPNLPAATKRWLTARLGLGPANPSSENTPSQQEKGSTP